MPKKKKNNSLTIADLVVLSLIVERPMHGYEINAELQRREVEDWAGVSKPQIYYSLRKLAKDKFIKSSKEDDNSLGPDRQTYVPTQRGLEVLVNQLGREDWATQRPPPPFQTWMVLSIHADRKTITKIVAKRESYLRHQIKKEEETLKAIRKDEGPTIPIADVIVEFTIKQYKAELEWLPQMKKKLGWN